ncbi:aldose 1-epimerase [Spirosoma luteolum]
MAFTITTQPFGTLPNAIEPLLEYTITDTTTGEYMTILPGYGGIVRELVLRKGDTLFSVLRGPESAQALVADESFASALLFPFPSRVRHGVYGFGDQQYALRLNEMSRDNAIHGLVYDKAFSVVSQEVTATEACLVVRYEHTGDAVGYPFPFVFTVTYSLKQSAGPLVMHLSYEAENSGSTACPVAFGWHPYFTLNGESVDDLTLTLPDRMPIALDAAMIPTGRQSIAPAETIPLAGQEIDAIYALHPTENAVAETVLHSPKAGVSLVVKQETGMGKLDYLVCYTPTRRDSVAIESLTANADAFNNGEGLVTLMPGHTLCGDISVRLD